MANQPESDSLFPENFQAPSTPGSQREDSGLLDLLSVGAKLKETDDDESIEPQHHREDSGLILFSAGDFGGGAGAGGEALAESAGQPADDEAMFGSFGGGLGGGFGISAEPAIADDLTPMGGAGSVAESRPAEVRPTPVEEPKRNPLTALAVVLGLAVVAAGAVYLTNDDSQKPAPQQVAQAEMSAKPVDDAAVGKAEPPPSEPVEVAAPIPEPVASLEGETEGALGDTDGLLAAADTSADDPMAQKAALLSNGGSNPVDKGGKWDPGTSNAAAGTTSGGAVIDDDPEPEPVVEPKPAADPGKKPAGGPANDDEVDCLLNPDLDKCSGGGGSKSGGGEVLAPKIPEKLEAAQLKDGFNTVKSKAKACGSKFGAAAGTKVKVHASIEGATGKVTEVSAQGEHAGTDLGKCVEDAVKDAKFSPFKKPSQGVDYSMIM